MEPSIRTLKHYIKKILGMPDIWWHIDHFEACIRRQSRAQHDSILAWAEQALAEKSFWENPARYEASTDPIVRQGWKLKQEVEREFKDKHVNMTDLRILIHVPDARLSPAGLSVFQNIIDAFNFIGIQAQRFSSGASIESILDTFKPNVLMTSDHVAYLKMIDWTAIDRYRARQKLYIGLTASLEEYGNTPLSERLEWAAAHQIDFYYSFRDPAYLRSRPEYKKFYEKGYAIFPIQFGANPLLHYPIPLDKSMKDLDYIFLGSTQGKVKGVLYDKYLSPIVSKYHGFISGSGWKHARSFHFNRERDRYLYARAKAGLNIHLPEQIEWACELNERTYQLAACGVPQVVDHAKLLDTEFSQKAFFVANNPQEYRSFVERILSDPQEAERRALQAQREVFGKHTIFHRASTFASMLSTHIRTHPHHGIFT